MPEPQKHRDARTQRITPFGLPRRADQAIVATAVAAALVLMAAWWIVRGGPQAGVIDIEKAAPRQVQFLVDINSAEWPELAQLPNVGETLARRIVASRQHEGPFAGPEDLLRVEGIGPKTLEGIRPHVQPIPTGEVLVQQGQGGAAAIP